MSWEEYKKKKEQNKSNVNTNISSSTNTEMSSWEKYKHKREQDKKNSETKSASLNTKNTDNYVNSGGFHDGYQIGDISRTILGTASDIGMNAIEGIVGIGEGIGDFASAGIAQVADWTGNDEYANRVRNNIANKKGHIISKGLNNAEKAVDEYSIVGDKGDEVVSGIGQTAGYMALNAIPVVGPVVSTGAMFGSAAGNSMSETYANGGENWQAWSRGIGSGLIETIVEKSLGFFGNSGGIDKTIANGISKRISSGFGKILARSGINATAESVEEAMSYIGNHGLDWVLDKYKKETGSKGIDLKENWDWEAIGEQMGTSFLSSLLTGGLMDAAQVSNIKKTNNMTTKDAINEYARQQDVQGQTEKLTNEINKLNKKLPKASDASQAQELQNELNWKNKQLNALNRVPNIAEAQNEINSPETIANKEETLYNNKESESGLNENSRGIEQDDKRRIQELFEQYERGQEYGSSSSQELRSNQSQQDIAEGTIKQELINYAKKYQKTTLTEQESKLKNIINKLGGDVVFYEVGDTNIYPGLANTKEFYIDTAGSENISNIFYHELTHYLRQTNNPIYISEIQPIVEEIASDFDYQEAIFNYAQSSADIFDVRNFSSERQLELAEEVIADYNASFYGDMEVDYGLPDHMRNRIKVSMDKIINGKGTETINNKEAKKKYTRKEVRNRLFKEMQISPEELTMGDDIKAINFQITDPVRVNEKVFGKELGDKVNNATINKTKHNTAEKIRWQNKERQEIKDLGIKARSKESAAVQKYGEKQWVNEKGEILSYGDIELANEFPNVETQNKIKKAATYIREKYDTYIDQINEVLTELGYDAIPKRTDYMRHFHELGDIFSKTGVPFNLNDMSAEDLPTDINGLTEFNKPGKNWFANSQKRYGNKTTYDAITGIDGYLEGAGNLIYHTEDIQNYRALSEAIRNQFGQTKGFENLEGLTDAEIQQRIKDIQDNKLSKYVAWLDEQANNLAGKKGAIDRGVERFLGRKGYTLFNTVKKQVGSNMTGFNVRSSLTNFISSTIASAKTNKIALAKGTISTIRNMFHNDGFIDKSDFLTSRFGSNSLSAKTWQKVSNAGQIFMTGSDYFTSNLIARSKYYEGLQKGMTEQEALNYSNDFSSKVMGDRSQGATPEVFNSKTLGLFTQFQLEVNNQWQYMVHDTKMDYQQNVKDKGGLKAGATVLFQMGQIAAYSYFFNELFEKLTGSRAAFDPIEIFKTLFGLDEEDKEKTFDQRVAEAGEMLVDNIPLGNLITGGGRIPISEAFEGIGTLGKKLTNQKNQYGGDISWKDVGSDILTSLPYWISPTGYSQAKKTTQGISTMIKGGDYKTNSEGEKELRFPVENKSASTYLKAGLFGKYSLPTSKEYINNDFKRLSAKQTKAYEESNISYTEYIKYLNQKLSKNEDKINYIENTKWSTEQKWGIYVNDILSDEKRKDGGSQVTDAKYMIKNGTSKFDYINCYNKAQKNNVDMPNKEEYIEMKESGLSLKTYINYSVKVKEETERQRKSGTIKEDGSIKDKDRIQIILDSTYTNTERTALYENYILDSDDKKYPIAKRTFTDNGLNITKYLEYKKQEFEGDKVDNGTVKGKTISGSKKKKVWDYIDNMKITGNQKLILWALEYEPSMNYQKQQVVNYVKSLKGVTEKEKLDMMSSFKGVTVYKDGSFKY